MCETSTLYWPRARYERECLCTNNKLWYGTYTNPSSDRFDDYRSLSPNKQLVIELKIYPYVLSRAYLSRAFTTSTHTNTRVHLSRVWLNPKTHSKLYHWAHSLIWSRFDAWPSKIIIRRMIVVLTRICVHRRKGMYRVYARAHTYADSTRARILTRYNYKWIIGIYSIAYYAHAGQ